MRTKIPFRHALTRTMTGAAVAAGTIGALTVPGTTASAAPMTFPVDTLSDDPLDGDTLREAIGLANANPGHDTIEFVDGLTGTLTMLGGTAMPSLTESLDIVGPGSDVIAIDAANSSRVFHSSTGGIDVSISGLTLTQAGTGFSGGAIRMGTINDFVMDDVTITESNVLGDGGAVSLAQLTGEITIRNSHFENNSAGGTLGGAISIDDTSAEPATIEGSSFVANEVYSGGSGGAVTIDAPNRSVVIDDTTFTGNEADANIGALGVIGADVVVGNATTFDQNEAVNADYGAIQLKATTGNVFVGGTFTANRAPVGYGGVGLVEATLGNIEITGSQIGNSAGFVGGTVAEATAGNVTVVEALIDDNDADFGIGNLAVGDSVNFDLVDSTVSNGDTGTGSGPGVWVKNVDDTLILRSTISGNTSADAAGGGAGVNISHSVAGQLDIRHSTLSGNSTAGTGGAVLGSNMSIDLFFSTFVGNHAGVEGGVVSSTGPDNVDINSSILADNTSPVGPSVNQPVDIDHSIVTDDPGVLANGVGNQFGVDPDLGPLADNGGTTLTHLPDVDSPAIDAADPGIAWLVGTLDQRGLPRYAGDGTDIGAVELPAPIWVPVTPARFVDTRAAGDTIDDQYEADGALAAGERRAYTIAGRGDIPADAKGVIAYVTAVQPAGDAYMTVDPCAEPMPHAASLNYTTGVTIGNEVIIGLENGELCVFSFAASQLTIDVVGYIPADSMYATMDPSRYLDTRAAGQTFDGQFEATGRPGAGEHIEIQVGGRGGLPVETTATMYVTAVNPTDEKGYATIWDCQGAAPLASSLNTVAGVNRGNEVLAKTGPSGEICIHTSDDVDLTVDVVGHVPDHQNYWSLDLPGRVLDSRATGQTIDGAYEAGGMTEAGSTLVLQVAGRGGIPADATTVAVNLAAIQPAETGWAVAFPCGEVPHAASINYVPGVNGSNEIIASLNETGQLCIHTSTAIHLAADVTGYTRG